MKDNIMKDYMPVVQSLLKEVASSCEEFSKIFSDASLSNDDKGKRMSKCYTRIYGYQSALGDLRDSLVDVASANSIKIEYKGY